MASEKKIRVAVLYGGRSAEHEVSCRSAANVVQYLDKSIFDVVPIGIAKNGHWLLGQDVFHKSLKDFTVTRLDASDDAWFTPEWVGSQAVKQQVVQLIKQQTGQAFDVVFPAVHGTFCEDGTLQGLLELANVPYVGCSVLASALGMDKDVSKRLVKQAGLNVTPFIAIKHDQWQANANAYLSEIENTLSFPVFVKPANTGSSIGINKVKKRQDLVKAIDEAFQFDTKILIEKALNIVELEVAVLESLSANTDPIVSLVGEIKTRGSHEFYSYDAKYLDDNGAELIIPAPLSQELTNEAREVAKKIFKILECESMVRVDLFLNKEDNQIYFNEINTLPGFTKISMYPKLMEASGILYTELLTRLVQLALKRHKKKSQLIRSYTDELAAAT